MVNLQSLCVIIATLTLLLAVVFLLCFGVECLIYWHAVAGGSRATLDYGRLQAAGIAFVGSLCWLGLWFLQELSFQLARRRAGKSELHQLLDEGEGPTGGNSSQGPLDDANPE